MEAEAGLLLALEKSALGDFVRGSALLYPLANVVHILGLAAFAAAVAIMDLRLLGAFADAQPAAFVDRWRRWAMVGFAVQVASGFLLFTAEATAIAENPLFRIKVVAIAVGLANVAAFQLGAARRLLAVPAGAPMPPAARLAGLVSLAAWLATAACGRLIAYF